MSATLCSFFGPPPGTPQAGMGVPGRPYVTIWFTCAGLKRDSTVSSAGARQVTVSGRVLPLSGGFSTNDVDPPLPSVPWQFAHRNDFVESYAFMLSLAKSVAPRFADLS